MMGYTHNGYRLWDPRKNKIITARDVVFLENKTLEDLKTTKITNIEINMKGSENEKKQLEHDVEEEEDLDIQVEEEEQSKLRKSARAKKVPSKYEDFEMELDHLAMSAESFVNDVPQSIEEAKSRSDYHLWKQAISEEMTALQKNNTWTLVKKPDVRLIDSKWVFRLKKDDKGNVCKYKARLVAKGFMQRKGLDYEETWAPVARLSTMRTLIAVINHKNLVVQQMDVKSAFLHGTITEEIYMTKPEGLICQDNLVCKLNKALYGLKQAPFCWNKKFNQFAVKQSLTRSECDPCLYFKHSNQTEIYLLLYVDDILIASNSRVEVDTLKQKLIKTFEMQDMGELKQFLGINFRRTADGIYLN